ncbi:MAG TPA: TIGR02206 family membrane protein [Thermoanaerobaculia bacterium]|nr:TIGR02206 family membrane protein [Thermoanaerobaculia bacterium]
MDHPPFEPFGPAHLAVLALTVLVPALLAWAVRRPGGEAWKSPIAAALALTLVANQIVLAAVALHNGLPWADWAPMQLCDWVTFLCAAALLRRHQLLFELTYFWGLAGTFQAVLTPDLPFGFPHPSFLSFQIAHAGIVVAVLYLVLGLGQRPVPRSILRAFLWIQVYLAAAALVNVAFGTNFGYLRAKPARASLLDLLGPWPWYILSLEALALVLFTVLYLPFVIADWRAWRRGAATAS